MTTRSFGYRRQQGMVLAIGLIFLVLLTLIGVSSIQTTTLDEKMAGNARDRNLAFQVAEATLRTGEAWIEIAGNAKTADATVGKTCALAKSWDWDIAKSANSLQKAPLDEQDNPSLAKTPLFQVAKPTLIRTDPKDPTSTVRRLYPVTAKATGGSENTVVILQSYCERPCVLPH